MLSSIHSRGKLLASSRPRIFIGSSSESLDVAESLQSLFDREFEPTVWTQGVFGLNESGLESLVHALDAFDFACFVVRKEDLTFKRRVVHSVPRDNVILEIGLFLGALGRERVFIIHERGEKPVLPSDLDGINMLDYFANRRDKNLLRALNPVCLEIKTEIRRLTAKNSYKTISTPRITSVPRRGLPEDSVTTRLSQCKADELVRFISITGRSFLYPQVRMGVSLSEEPGPSALISGVKFQGILLNPESTEAEFRSSVESPKAHSDNRLLMTDAKLVARLPALYKEEVALPSGIIKKLHLKYSNVGLGFSLWLFYDVAFTEPYHFGKRADVPHLCGFTRNRIPKGTEEFVILQIHFGVLWNNSTDIPWEASIRSPLPTGSQSTPSCTSVRSRRRSRGASISA